MKHIIEAVDLPDPSVQQLVHPLDVPQARRPFIVAWWLHTLTLPTVIFGFAAILWGISNNYVTPILVPSVIAIGAVFSRMYYLSEAWAYIPRKRQDREHRMPVIWTVLKSVLAAVVFLLGLIALIQWFTTIDLATEVVAYSAGMSIAVVFIMVVTLLWTLLAPRRLSVGLGGFAPQLVSIIVVIAALAYGFQQITGSGMTRDWDISDLIIGGSILLGLQLVLWLSKLLPSRRSRSGTASSPSAL